MRASIAWINEYLDRAVSSEEAGEILTAVGFPIDGEGIAENGEAWLEVETTSNRGDCLCHLALAREIAAASGRTGRWASPGPAGSAGEPMTVRNEVPQACSLYTARVIEGVEVAASPPWLARRLESIGQIPRNNLVDATNFVLWELGQPTHVFDLATLRGGRIEIRFAREGESLLPLGEGAVPIRLTAEDLVIADAERPVALAGVKGGAETAVTAGTTAILVEAATFDPVAVRNASRRHGIRSDSSYRFERGVHPAEVNPAAERLVALILEIAGGRLRPGVAADGRPIPAPRSLSMRLRRCEQVLGVPLPAEQVESIFERLDLKPRLETSPEPTVRVTVPPRRLDLDREIDLVEEACRIAGIEAIPVRETLSIRPAPLQRSVEGVRRLRDALAEAGFLESVTHSLVSERLAEPFLGEGEQPIRVDDARAGGTPILRPSLVPSLLEVLARNEGLGAKGLGFFEVAAAFRMREAGGHSERREVAIVLDGGSDAQAAVRRLRGAVERVGRILAGGVVLDDAADGERVAYLHPQLAVRHGETMLGRFGLLEAGVAQLAGLDRTVAVAELSIDALLDRYPPPLRIEDPPQFPPIERDLSIVVEEAVAWAAIERCIRGLELPLLADLSFVTTYRGRGLPPGRKSVTLRLLFRDPARTLRHEEVEPGVAAAVEALRRDLGGELRGAAS